MIITAAETSGLTTLLQRAEPIRRTTLGDAQADLASPPAVTVEISDEAQRAARTQVQIASMRLQGFSDASISEWQEKGGIDIGRLAGVAKWGNAPAQPGEARVMQYQEQFRLLGFSDSFLAEHDHINSERVAREDAQDIIRQAGDETVHAASATDVSSVAAALRDPLPGVPSALRDAFDAIQGMIGAVGSSSSAYGQQILSDPALRARIAEHTDINSYIEMQQSYSSRARGEAEAQAGRLGQYGLDRAAILRDSNDQLVVNSFTLSNVAGFRISYDAVTDKVAVLRGDRDIAPDLAKGVFTDQLTGKPVAAGSDTLLERVDGKLRDQKLSDMQIAAWHEKYDTFVSAKEQDLQTQTTQFQGRNRARLDNALAAEADPVLRDTAGAATERAWLESGRRATIARSQEEQGQAAAQRLTRGGSSPEAALAAHNAMAKALATNTGRHPAVQGYQYSNGEVTFVTRRTDQNPTLNEQLRQSLKAPIDAMRSTIELIVEAGNMGLNSGHTSTAS